MIKILSIAKDSARKFYKNQAGLTALEYVILGGVVALAIGTAASTGWLTFSFPTST